MAAYSLLSATMQDFETLGAFYLGRPYDLATQTATPAPLMYDSRDLLTHAVCIGMTGSGKTGLCIGLLEEALIDGIPAIIIDPKGDLANLALTFPSLVGRSLRAMGERGRGAACRTGRADVCRRAGRTLAEGTRELGPGRRARQAAA